MIEIKNVAKYYKNSTSIGQFNLRILPGEVVGILGENGAGKTTLLKAVANIIPIDTGEVTLEGKPVTGEAYNKLSLITEEGSYFLHLNAKEHLEFSLK